MPQIINTNIASLNAQRNLNNSQGMLGQAVQRLSSGLRINSAKDDAAGLAIATRMTTQVGGLTVAIRNANDGISIAQTAEGAMVEMTNALNRMSDLAVQAASFNTDSDRQSLNNEVSQLIQEMSRIVDQTRFNGQKLLTGGFSASIQVGAFVNETIGVDVSNLSPTGLGVATNYAATQALGDAAFANRLRNSFEGTLTAATATINGQSFLSADITTNTTSASKIQAINAATDRTGVSAFNYGNAAVGSENVDDADLLPNGNSVISVTSGEVVINGIAINASAGGNELAANINAKSAQTGVTAVYDDTATANQNRLVLFNRDGGAIEVSVSGANAATLTGFAQGSTSVDAGENGLIILNDELNSTTVTYDSGLTGTALVGVGGANTTLTNASVASQTVNTQAAANLAILSFAQALDVVNADRSVLGAKMNRFDSLIRNLDNVRENITAARSRIQDADFAAETAQLTKAQILQQAGTAMVSQANALPQTVLSLLQ